LAEKKRKDVRKKHQYRIFVKANTMQSSFIYFCRK